MEPVFSVVIPVYNEQDVVAECYGRITAVMAGMSEPYELLFVDDGSRDRTAIVIAALRERDARVRLLRFSRNFGQQAAVSAGVDYARGEAVVVIDAALQDPPEVIPRMAALWKEGFDVVVGKRTVRRGETPFRRAAAYLYYRMLNRASNVDIPADTGDFRLIDRKVCTQLKRMSEHNRYFRGMVSWVGFKQTSIEYERDARFAGRTKYRLGKLIKLSLDGITGYSRSPLRFAAICGFVMLFAGVAYFIATLCELLDCGVAVFGMNAVLAAVATAQGTALVALWLVGEYIVRIYEEIKGRPVYIVSEELGFEDE